MSVYECGGCDHSFTYAADGRRTQYTEDYFTTHANWFRYPNLWLYEFIFRQIVKHATPNRIALLDVGCGTGGLLKFLFAKNAGIDLYGIDLRCNNHPGITFIEGDVLTRDLPMRFDVVTSLAAIEHVDDIVRFVDRIKTLLVPGGTFVVNTVNTRGVFYTSAKILNRVGFIGPYQGLYERAHLHHFTNASLRRLLEDAGFNVVLQKNHNYPFRAISLPPCGNVRKCFYLCGAAALFALPSRFGILQTVIARKKI